MKRIENKMTIHLKKIIVISALFHFSIYASFCQKNIPKIDLVKEIKNEDDITLSRFVKKVEYVPLELTNESTIEMISKIYLTKDYLIIGHNTRGSSNKLLIFNPKTGKFIRNIGNVGKGPDEYLRLLNNFYNPYNNLLYAISGNIIKIYNLAGDYITSFEQVKINDPITSTTLRANTEGFINGDTFVRYINNSSGSINKRISITSKTTELKSFPNYHKWNNNDVNNNVYISQDPIFFTNGSTISFKERSNDTIFEISTNKLSPKYILTTGSSKYPYILPREEAINQISKPKDYFETNNIFENSKYLFFDLVSRNMPVKDNPGAFKLIRNFCIYDKIKNTTYVCQNNENKDYSSLTDDINNFISPTPITVTQDNIMIAVIQAYDVVKWRNTNPEMALKLKHKYPWIHLVTELDNPIIVYYTLFD